MKKIYLAILAFLMLASIPALAQKGLYLGAAVTEQSTWITNQNNYGLREMDYSMTWGLGYNLNIGWDFNDHIGVKVELGSAQFGQNYTDQLGDSAITRDVKMTHFQIPVMFKYRLGGKVVKFYIAAGPQFDFLSSAKQDYAINGIAYNDTLVNMGGESFNPGSEDIKERFTSMDVFVRMDLGVEFMVINHLMIDFGLKTGYGLMDINATDYQMPDRSSGTYHPSHDVFAGLTLGVNWHF